MPRLETLRAKAGATLLDIVRPGWADEIDLSQLDLASCEGCVLGQLYGRYENGAAHLFAMEDNGPRADTAARAGFVSWGPSEKTADYSRLTAAWRRQIEKRQAA